MENDNSVSIYSDNGCRDALIIAINSEYDGRDPEYYEYN